jgi:hypothetical protein
MNTNVKCCWCANTNNVYAELASRYEENARLPLLSPKWILNCNLGIGDLLARELASSFVER